MEKSQEPTRVDISNLRAIAGGDESFVAALLMKMCRALPLAFTNMENFASESDWPGLKSAAHKAKSTFAYLGLDEMKNRLKDIEHQAMEEIDLETLPKQVEEAVVVGKKILTGLEYELAQLS